MTLKELSQLYHLNLEIENDRRRLEELEEKISSPSSPNLSGMPRSTVYNNKIESSVADLIDLKAIISAKQQQCIYEYRRLLGYITEIDDSLTREIFTYRFVNGLSWRQVAVKMGGNNTEESVKKICYRYLNNQNRKVDKEKIKDNFEIEEKNSKLKVVPNVPKVYAIM